ISGARNLLAFHREGVALIDGIDNHGFTGNMHDAVKGADVFIGVSAANVLTETDVQAMAINSIVFALANPDPEIDPTIARKYAAVVATGRSDHPNQINNVLAFPGIFRGLLDANASKITDELLVAAADAIASCVAPAQLNANFIIPSVFDPEVAKKVATAVKEAAK
ncbi:MAG: malic enzyme-like NAD(P)-binding protein, partial [Candidatus Nanopelagicaceae bacterium]